MIFGRSLLGPNDLTIISDNITIRPKVYTPFEIIVHTAPLATNL